MKLSLITVTYNSNKTLSDTLQSVLGQTYSDIEYIIVDGASKDGTVSIIKEYEPKFQGRMKWISERDNGLYDAMNKGIRMATGDVVGVINSDDFYHRADILQNVADAFKDCLLSHLKELKEKTGMTDKELKEYIDKVMVV